MIACCRRRTERPAAVPLATATDANERGHAGPFRMQRRKSPIQATQVRTTIAEARATARIRKVREMRATPAASSAVRKAQRSVNSSTCSFFFDYPRLLVCTAEQGLARAASGRRYSQASSTRPSRRDENLPWLKVIDLATKHQRSQLKAKSSERQITARFPRIHFSTTHVICEAGLMLGHSHCFACIPRCPAALRMAPTSRAFCRFQSPRPLVAARNVTDSPRR